MGIDRYTIAKYNARRREDVGDEENPQQEEARQDEPAVSSLEASHQEVRTQPPADEPAAMDGGVGQAPDSSGLPDVPEYGGESADVRQAGEAYVKSMEDLAEAKKNSLSDYLSHLEEERRTEEERGRRAANASSWGGVMGGLGEALSALAVLRGTVKGSPMIQIRQNSPDWMRRAEAERKERESKLSGLRDRQAQARAKRDNYGAEATAASAAAEYERLRDRDKAAWDARKDEFGMNAKLAELGVSGYRAVTEREDKRADNAREDRLADARVNASNAAAKASEALADQRRRSGGSGGGGKTTNLVIDGDTYHFASENTISDNLSQHRDEIAADLSGDELEEYSADMDDAAASGASAVMDVVEKWAQRSPTLKGILKQASDGMTPGDHGHDSGATPEGAGTARRGKGPFVKSDATGNKQASDGGEVINGIKML